MDLMSGITSDGKAPMSGVERMRALKASGITPPIEQTMGYSLIEIDDGRVAFEGKPDLRVYNPVGSVHGGFAATLLDSACSAAAFTKVHALQGLTTLELKVAYHRPLNENSAPVRAEGRVVSIGRRTAFSEASLKDRHGVLCATATSTLLIFDITSNDVNI